MAETVTEGDVTSKGTIVARPTITVPPRASMDAFFTAGSVPGFSPGPLTMVSSFFSEQSPFSFSQLLVGAMASPIAKPGFLAVENNLGEEKEGNSDDGGGRNSDGGGGYKRNRPVNLVVTPPQMQLDLQSLSPLFTVPPGLSPSGLLNSPGFLSPLQSPFGMSHQQALAHVTAQAALSQTYMQMQAEYQFPSSSARSESPQPQIVSLPLEPKNSKTEPLEVSLSDKKAASSVAVDKPNNDGYNWRKYGQKQVKASEYPRSYYKCTHLNCPVKKKVERSLDGHITEITYKGQDNHDLPPAKRGRDNGTGDGISKPQVKLVIDSQSQSELSRVNVAAPSQPGLAKVQMPTQSLSQQLPVMSNLDDKEDSTVVIDEGDDDEPNAKRRSIGTVPSVQASSHKTVTESKIVVQTRSEVDLLDDGFKWRKYGQKVVKGNPHPRSYYKCTYAGCNVRKHVERSSTDSKAVITTYEGKHDHEIPAGRYSKPQKMVANIENKDQMAMTLQLKEEVTA